MVNAITEKISGLSSEIRDQATNTKNEFTAKISGIQQQLVVQSNEQNNIVQSVNQVKATITEKLNNAVQQPLVQQPPQQQPISTQSVVINGSTSLLTSAHLSTLKEWIPNPVSTSSQNQSCRLDLLYKGSRDGFTSQKFHEKCDSKSPTVSFIKSQTYGQIFGGYTEQTWNQGSDYEKKMTKLSFFP